MNEERKIDGSLTVVKSGPGDLMDYMRSREKAMAEIGGQVLNPKRLIRIVASCVSRTPALKECTMSSILNAVMQSVECGLEPGSSMGEAYLVPFKDARSGKSICTFIPGYMGFAKIAWGTGLVKNIEARVVYEGEHFEVTYSKDGVDYTHIPKFETDDPKKITHAYARVELTTGGVMFEAISRSQIDAIRNRSRAKSSGPWVTDYEMMARKTVFKRLTKYMPKDIKMGKALAADTAADTGDLSVLSDFDTLEGEVVESKTPPAAREQPADDAQAQGATTETTYGIADERATPPDEELLKP